MKHTFVLNNSFSARSFFYDYSPFKLYSHNPTEGSYCHGEEGVGKKEEKLFYGFLFSQRTSRKVDAVI